MEIKFLTDYPHFAVPLAQYHYDQWHDLLPWWSYAEALRELQSHRYTLPTTLIAVEQEQLLGSASLVIEDLPEPELPEFAALSPWLASVFVLPTARKRGVGRALVAAVEHQAKTLQIPQLHLFTEDQAMFYQHMGWSTLAQTVYRDKSITVMVKSCKVYPIKPTRS